MAAFVGHRVLGGHSGFLGDQRVARPMGHPRLPPGDGLYQDHLLPHIGGRGVRADGAALLPTVAGGGTVAEPGATRLELGEAGL